MGKVVGEGYPDLIVWLKTKKKRVALVIDLKSTSEIKEDHEAQVAKYIQELKKQLKEGEEVYPVGFIFDFTKPSGKKLKEGVENYKGLKILYVCWFIGKKPLKTIGFCESCKQQLEKKQTYNF